MLHRDYLVRMFSQLAAAIRETILRSRNNEDPETLADLLEDSLSNATEIDGSLLLQLATESMAAMLQFSGTDPRLVAHVARVLLLEARYLDEAGHTTRAELRRSQAQSLSDSFDLGLDESCLDEKALEEFFESHQAEM